MKRLNHLFEKVVSFENLLLASKKALRGKKSRASVAHFYFHLENELITLQSELASENYRPSSYHQFEIREPKVRQICSSRFRDRVVHHAICNWIEEPLERRLIHDTYACRLGKGAHAAVNRTQEFTRRNKYFLKCDIRKYFQSIDHSILKSLLRRILKDKKLLRLIDLIINHGVPDSAPGKGLPIGNLTSQHFANFYLGELDHYLKERLRLKAYVRYMDDFISFSNDKNDLQELLEKIRQFASEKLKLELKKEVVRIAPVSEGVPFLGFRIFPNLIRLQRPNLVRFRKKLKKREAQFRAGLIDEKQLAVSVGSMVAHIQHVNSTRLRRRDFEISLAS